MHSILQKTKNGMNQTFDKSGSAVFAGRHLFLRGRNFSILALCLSLFLVGSCNESAGIFDFSNKPADLTQLSKSDLMRYGYALQVAMLQSSDNIKKLEARDIKLALSAPDFSRKDGRNNIWQYRTESCVLDIHWQEKKSSAPVSHFEFRQRRSALNGTQAVIDPVEWQCVQSIIQDRRDKIGKGFREAYADLSLKAHKS